jgi:hypothetical protein
MTEEVFEKLKQQLYNAIDAITSSGVSLTAEKLERFIDSQLMFVNDITCEDKEAIKLYLESHIFVEHDHDGYIIMNHEDGDYNNDWYTQSDHTNEHFWKLYKQYLIQDGSLDFSSLNKLDEVTLPRLMNCLGNPKQELLSQRVRYGMVIGDVQSGKTSTYAGLICKAADAGMKVVILLAGQTETLRQQTQERMEEDIVGYTIRTDNDRNSKQQRVGVGKLKGYKPIVTAYTSYEDDFKMGHDKTMSSLEAQSSLVMFIVKKNVPVLNRLYKWLTGEGQVKNTQGKLPYSLLLIDDEADNASINTKKDAYNPTKTNAIIRKICEAFDNSNYVGFTATPYANIFINPEKDENMETTDLFPKDFIYVLPTPDAYIGALRMFSEPDDKNPSYGNCGYMLKHITDITEPTRESLSRMSSEEKVYGPIYYKHQSDWRGTLPESLYDALKCFYLSNAIRDLDGAKNAPRTMLVNISRFQQVESYIKAQLALQVEKDYKEINCNFNGEHHVDIHLPLYKKLYDLFIANYSNCGFTYKEVLNKDVIMNAIEKIRVIVVNGSKESKEDAPDYKTNPSQRIIAVGGLALSRGLTLKNLMISYFYRNTSTYDTLMQMGRWFGYRPKYDRLCRVWITQSSANWYREIAEATEELKNSLRIMDKQNLTPKEFGLKVRRDDVALQITARNKMRNSMQVIEIESLWGNIFETPYFSKLAKDNDANLLATKQLLNKILEESIAFEKRERSSAMLAQDVPVKIILDFLHQIHISAANHRFPLDSIIDNIIKNTEESNELKFWDVAIAGGTGPICELTPSIVVKKSLRKLTDWSENVYSFTNRGVVGGNNDGKIGLDNPLEIEEEYIRMENKSISGKTWFKYAKRKPLLILYPVGVKDTSNLEASFLNYLQEIGTDPIMGFALGFPGYGHPDSQEHQYYINIVYQKQVDEDDAEIDDEDLI